MAKLNPEAGSQHTYKEEVSLALSASAGNRNAQHLFLTRLMPQVRRTVSYMTNNPDWAADLSQTVLIRLLNNAGSYKGESSLEFWASRVTSRVALNEMQKRSRRSKLQHLAPTPDTRFVSADEAASEMWAKRTLARMLSKLSDKHRIAIVLRHVEGYTVDEIAKILDIPPNTVRERLRVARVRLRRSVTREPDLKNFILGRRK